MPKRKECNLTKKEWTFFCNILDAFYENTEITPQIEKMMNSIHMKVFFMDALIKQQEEKNV